MRRRRADGANESLDLLLDAVSNTFGGILFLAVLIAILLRFSGDPTTASTTGEHEASDASPTARDIEAARRAVEELQIANAQARDAAAAMGAVETNIGYERYVALQVKSSGLQAELAARNRDLSELSVAVTKLEAELDSSTREKQSLELEIAAVHMKIRQETKTSTRTAQLPSLRATDKQEFPVIVRYGRVYLPYSAKSYGVNRVRTLDSFVVLANEADMIRITPKPYAGIRVAQEGSFTAKLRTRLAGLDEERFYIALAVWDDSFGEFGVLRSDLVSMGFEYRTLPIPAGGAIIEGGSGDPFVQ
ncbi:hypothetical protein Pla123a_43880 [Posidoniimonas polymericola]|uniref:Uncharacterized protein n=1 Tax=Posidoniimonas polymericola TaxID=2528002 RepID=A0A5C5XWR8_9BACT|nr:hypothetical protein [Posidoniimonas polymericola]TWT66959.1 hypothetical protein Pla123a_43880 [Posidoniimonas polymericola]